MVQIIFIICIKGFEFILRTGILKVGLLNNLKLKITNSHLCTVFGNKIRDVATLICLQVVAKI